MPFIPVSLKYLRFDGNTVVFEFTLVSSHLNKAVSWLNQRLEVKVPAFVRFQYPDVFVDVGTLLEQKNIRGVRVREIHFEDGEFAIVTENV